MHIPLEHLNLVTRQLFGRDDNGSKSNHTCPAAYDPHQEIRPFVGSMTYHTFATILSGACGIAVILIALLHLFRHATHYSSPVQQRQIIRIICLIPLVSIVCFLCVWLNSATLYILPAIDVGSAIALAAFLLLLCDYIISNPNGFDELFGAGALARGQFAPKSPPMLKRVWYIVLQFLPVSIILWITTAASLATGTYCSTSNKIYFAHIWVEVIRALSSGAAIIAVIRFYSIKKSMLAPHSVLMKLFAFKGVIGLSFLQTFIINILISSKVIKPSHILTLNDVNALPSLILGVEMPIFSIFLLFAYNTTPYKQTSKGGFFGGPLGVKAIIHALNPVDILSAFFRGPMRLVRSQAGGFERSGSEGIPLNGPHKYVVGDPTTYNPGYSPVPHTAV